MFKKCYRLEKKFNIIDAFLVAVWSFYQKSNVIPCGVSNGFSAYPTALVVYYSKYDDINRNYNLKKTIFNRNNTPNL